MSKLEANFKHGAAGEALIARYLDGREDVAGYIKHCDGGGDGAPMMSIAGSQQEILPDFEVFRRDGSSYWLELKSYDSAAYNRNRAERVHGIAERQMQSYGEVEKATGRPVWIAVLTLRDGALRWLSLKDILEIGWACECSGCRDGPSCKNKEPLMYCPADRMELIHRFERADLVGVDRAQASARLPILGGGERA